MTPAEEAEERVGLVMRPILFELGGLALTWGPAGAWHLREHWVRMALREVGLEAMLPEVKDRWLGARPPPPGGGYWT